jgi:hypothetical protein
MSADQLELQLQQELERFTTQFMERVTQATETLERSPDPRVSDAALRKNLLYASSAMEIASGPFSEINLLDMIVFIRLSRRVLETHWIPELYGEDGGELAEVFARSDRDLAEVAAQTLAAAQREQLDRLVDAWLEENPGQIRVEGIRLNDFSTAAGSAASERALVAKGLLSGVKTATRAANQAMLLSERALFLFHRLPFLWRLQARVAAREMLGDAVTHLASGPRAPLAQLTRESRRLLRRGAIYVGLLGAVALASWQLTAFLQRRALRGA